MLIRAFTVWLVVVSTSIIGCTTRPGEFFSENRQLANAAQLTDSLQQADFIILGEQHDNPHHHAMQLEVLKGLHARGWLKQLSLEMMVPSQQPGADLAFEEQITDLDTLYSTLSWDNGWDWTMYGPIVSWAISAGIPLKSANLDKGELNTVRENPVRLGQVLLGEDGLDIHRNQFRASHCGHVSQDRVETMLRVQVARDARMAASLLSVDSGAALLAGNWHARKDIGVPLHILSLHPDTHVLTLGFMEEPIDDDENLAPLYDIIWTTPGVERPDFCAMFKNGELKQP